MGRILGKKYTERLEPAQRLPTKPGLPLSLTELQIESSDPTEFSRCLLLITVFLRLNLRQPSLGYLAWFVSVGKCKGI